MPKQSLFFLLVLCCTACIQDDVIFDTVEPTFRITASIDTLLLNDTYDFTTRYTNNIGETETVDVSWSSSAPQVLQINDNGTATALQIGTAIVTAEVQTPSGQFLQDQQEVSVAAAVSDMQENTNNTRSGSIRTTSSYLLEGSFNILAQDSGIRIEIADDYQASNRLPGLYLYLTNNPNSTANALEVGKVEVFNGAHHYDIPNTGLQDYDYLLYFCKPFSVKVGDGTINE